jgi:hypothetical protein
MSSPVQSKHILNVMLANKVLQAPKHNDITLTLKMLDFGSAICEEESIIIYEGHSTRKFYNNTIIL